jgi:hypothetical protein
VRHAAVTLLIGLVVAMAAGCQVQLPATGFEGAGLGVRAGSSLAAGPAMARFRTARYAFHDADTVTAVLLPDAADRRASPDLADTPPPRAITLRLMWRSKAARTPIDPDATNCAFQYVVFEDDGDVGVYSGAGFILLSQKPGTDRIDARILKATLVLSDATDGFTDPVGRAEIAGRLTLVRDDDFVNPAIRRLNATVTDRLGFPRLVGSEHHEPPLAAR